MLKSRRRFLLGASAVAAAVLLKPWSRFDLFPAPADAAGAMSEQTRLMMGTLVSVRTRPGAGTAAAEAVRAAFAEAARLEALLTRHESAAPLGVLNRQGTIRDVPPELRQVLSAAARVAKTTDHAFNPLAATLVEARRQGAGDDDLKRLEPLIGPDGLRTDGAGLTLNAPELVCSLDGIAKGFIVDAMSRVLRERGVRDHLINAGGDIFACGGPDDGRPWTVGILGPEGRIARVVSLRDRALATSGNAESMARGYEHIARARNADPTAPRPFSASAAATNATLADAYATALFAMDPVLAERAAERVGVELTLVKA